MEEYELFKKKRRIKQFLSAVLFVAVIALGWHYPLLGYFIPLCMILGVGIGLARGRRWCDWYCPRGSFYDTAAGLVSPKRNIPALFKNIYFRVTVLVLLFAFMVYNLIRAWPDPRSIGLFFVIMLSFTTTLGVILALAFHERSWCYLCPIGTLINLTGRNRQPLKIDSRLCVDCKLCAKACPVQIKPYLYKGKGVQVVKDKDCLSCGSCISVCPKKALHF